MNSDKQFCLEDMVVGHLEGNAFPTSSGIYRYMPYRGPGHYRLITSLKAVGPQRCYFLRGGERRYFTVMGCPSYGRLELASFESD